MDDELIKALNGYANGGLHMADASQATDSSSSGGGGLALAMVNPTSAPFDTMGFEQSNGFDMNSFDVSCVGLPVGSGMGIKLILRSGPILVMRVMDERERSYSEGMGGRRGDGRGGEEKA